MGLLSLLLLSSLMLQNGQGFSSSQGKQFITAFMENFETNRPSETSLKLFLVGHGNDARVSVTVTKSSSRHIYSVAGDETVPVDLPVSLEMKGSGIFAHSIVIESQHDISVVLFNRKLYSIASMTLYPVHELGDTYYVITPPGTITDSYRKEFAVIAWKTPTQVTIEPQGKIIFKRRLYAAGSTLTVSLKAFEVLQLQSTEDLSGTRIQSSAPVAVLSGHVCVQENYYCDHVAEQLLPISKWGQTFIIPPVPLQTGFDIIYVVACQNTRVVYQSGQDKGFQDMVPGEIARLPLQLSQALYISADAGIQVAFFFTGIKIGNIGYDPFLINVPDVTSYGLAYRIDGFRKFDNHVLLIAKSSETVTWDKSVVAGIQWQLVPGSEYSWGEYIGMQILTNIHFSWRILKLPLGCWPTETRIMKATVLLHHLLARLLTCPENSHYLSCGNACPATCSDRTAPSRCENTCAEVCQCDEGYLFNGEKCVPRESCNCTYKGMTYGAGEEFWADENCQSLCRCDNRLGRTVCEKSSCKAKTKCIVVNGVRGCHATTYSTCIAAGDLHYVSFDGTKYDFVGSCVYQMVGVCSKNPALTPFLVTVENSNRGYKSVSFTKAVTLEVYNMTISLSKSAQGRIEVNGILVDLPFSYENKLTVSQGGIHTTIMTDFDMRIGYDSDSNARVTLPSTYANSVCGLCGNANQNPHDDFDMQDGSQTSDVTQFANRWKVKDVPGCTTGCTGKCQRCTEAEKRTYQVERYCGILTKSNGPFALCYRTISPTKFFKDCVVDTCTYKGHPSVFCGAIATYARTCQAQNIQIKQWRSNSFCSFSCLPNSHYELCGNGCPSTCRDLANSNSCDAPCVEGCVCDSGFILSGDECVPLTECGCVHEGRYYKKGAEFYPTNTCREKCRCVDVGVVDCHQFSCGSYEECRVENGIQNCYPVGYGTVVTFGGSHYVTLDGNSFDFAGSSSYILTQITDRDTQKVMFSVVVEHENADNGSSTEVTSVVIYLPGNTIVLEREKKWQAKVQDEFYNLPFSKDDGELWISQEGNNIIVRSSEGFKIIYDTDNYVEVFVPRTYQKQTTGLGGNFNNNLEDDFMLPDGTLTPNVDDFGISWEVPTTGSICSKNCVHKLPAYDEAQSSQHKDDRHCGLLTLEAGPFKDCHSFVSPADFFHNCLYDMQVVGEGSLCQNLQAYTAKCQAAGAEIDDWRTAVSCQTASAMEINSSHLISLVDNPQMLELSFLPVFLLSSVQIIATMRHALELVIPAVPVSLQCNALGIVLKVADAGESIFSTNCTGKWTCQGLDQIIYEETACQNDEICVLQNGVRGCERREGQCKISREAQLVSFDGTSARWNFCGGVYDVSSVCDESDPSWFRVSVNIGKDCEDNLSVVKAAHVYFGEAAITLKKNNRIWEQNGIVINWASDIQVQFSPDGGVTVKVKDIPPEKLCGPSMTGCSKVKFKYPDRAFSLQWESVSPYCKRRLCHRVFLEGRESNIII
ncbi:hypothetical protein E2320_000562 [Naja naja]|nr:hypothetical protein E2320_000562 [Naja naja]